MSVHDQWNARRLRVTKLEWGFDQADFVWVDDGPAHKRKRNPDISFFLVYHVSTNWAMLKGYLWRWLEGYRRRLR